MVNDLTGFVDYKLTKIGNRWNITPEFIDWLEKYSRYFTSKTELCDYLGVYRDFFPWLLKRYDVNLNLTSTYDTGTKRLYLNKEWCIDQYITQMKTIPQISAEFGYTQRVLQKWIFEKFHLCQAEVKHEVKLSPIQRELIIASRLGDGHVSKHGGDAPYFIVSHAENQKEYLFWKYDILKNLCNHEPTRSEAGIAVFNGKEYNKQPEYRINTYGIYELAAIREIPKIQIIRNLSEFGIAIWFLDDASYSKSKIWELCVGGLSEEEKHETINMLYNYDIEAKIKNCDNRYIDLTVASSAVVTSMILKHIPNNIDVVKYKILQR